MDDGVEKAPLCRHTVASASSPIALLVRRLQLDESSGDSPLIPQHIECTAGHLWGSQRKRPVNSP